MTHRRRTRGGPPARAGFTLIETVLVMTIIGIVAAFAMPRWNTAAMHADAAARLVRGTLQVAQRTAVARQYDVIVGFDATRGLVRVTHDRNNNGAIDTGEPTASRSVENRVVLRAGPAALPGMTGTAAVTLSRPRTIGGLPSVIFRRNGAASSDVAVFLRASATDAANVRAVGVEQATGRTEWFKYLGGAWRPSDR